MKSEPLSAPSKKRLPFDREDMEQFLKTCSTETLTECLAIIGGRPTKSRYWMILALLNHLDDEPICVVPPAAKAVCTAK